MISIDWASKIITIPRADLTLLSSYNSGFSSAFGTDFGSFGPKYTYSIEQLRLELKDLEDGEEGMAWPNTHARNAPSTLSGVTYAQTFEIINGYTVTFEDGNYQVVLTGANHNLGDVKNVNQVSIVVGNSAGLIVAGSGVTLADIAAIADKILNRNLAGGSDGGRTVKDALRASRNRAALSMGTLTVYEEDDATIAWTATFTTGARDPLTAIDPA